MKDDQPKPSGIFSHARPCAGHLAQKGTAFLIEIAGTSPAMTSFDAARAACGIRAAQNRPRKFEGCEAPRDATFSFVAPVIAGRVSSRSASLFGFCRTRAALFVKRLVVRFSVSRAPGRRA